MNTMKWKKALGAIGLILLVSSQANAEDLGFRYKNKKCINEKGAEGLNPYFFGQCADFRGVIMARFGLDRIDFSGSRFDNADIEQSSFDGAIFEGVSFAGANLTGVKLNGARIIDANFKKAALKNAQLGYVDFQNDDFSEVDFSGMALSFSRFENCVFSKAKCEGTLFDGAEFIKSALDHISCVGANFQGANLESSDVSSSDFSKANMTKAVLRGVKGENAVFEHALLRNADLSKALFKSADFKSARMENAILNDVDFRAVNFRSASLTDSKITGAVLSDAIFNKATVLPISHDDAISRGMKYIAVSCDPKLEVELEDHCYYLDGSGGKCEAEYVLASQSLFPKVAAMFAGKNYKHAVSDNCCIWSSGIDKEGENWGMNTNCNAAGPFTKGPELAGAGCTGANNRQSAQLTFCVSQER